MWNDNHEITAETLLKAAQEAAAYIESKKIQDEKGVRWSLADALSGKHFCNDEISLYSGSAGIGRFLLNLSELTGKEKYLEDAVSAADYMLYRWEHQRALDKNFSLYAYTTGYAGVAAYLLQIASLTGDSHYADGAKNIIAQCIADAKSPTDGRGRYWSDYPGIVGNAGTILFLLHAAEICGREDWKRFAVQAGEYYLDKGHAYGGGLYYDGVNPAYFGAGSELIDPNFPMGTAGIGYLLLKLYEVSKDERFLQAEEPVLKFMERVAVRQRWGILLPHALPERVDLFYLSYCHGPVGTIRYFYKGYQIRKKESYREWGNDLLDGLLASGAPKRRSPGFWNVHNFCCGTAGLMNLFAGLWADGSFADVTQDRLLALSQETARVLLSSQTEILQENGNRQTYWIQALDRVTPNRLSASIGYYEGAAGIADALLTLYRMLTGQFTVSRAVDDPFPSTGRSL